MTEYKRTWCGELDLDTPDPLNYECGSFEELRAIQKANVNNVELHRNLDMLQEDCKRLREIINSL